MKYIDLFSGCGGLSLGLSYAKWQGVFALEKDAMAFETMYKNQIAANSTYAHFNDWPTWLEKKNHDIKEFLANDFYKKKLEKMAGEVDLLVGGPPCQGFSVGGARKGDDERNYLVFEYLKFADILKPKALIIENVEGMARAFKSTPGKHEQSTLQIVLEELDKIGYTAGFFIAKALDAGVPQNRKRVITFALRKELFPSGNPALILEKEYQEEGFNIRKEIGLSLDRPTNIGEAIDDLSGADYVTCPDSPKFKSSKYLKANSIYQKFMRKGARTGSTPNSHRFSEHGDKVLNLYKEALNTQKAGRLSKDFLLANNTKTQKKFLLGKEIYASTLTTHPDEHIHYKYPRNVSLREMARLQSFPDDFIFYGRYTLNGERRKLDVSRCAQIGNAVPVLMGNALGQAIKNILTDIELGKINDTSYLSNTLKPGENIEMFN